MTSPEAYAKKLLVLRNLLVGRGYFNALAAVEFGLIHHKGVRKDGVTPEYDHQVSIMLYVLTLPTLIHPEATLCAIALHDVREDYDISHGEIIAVFPYDMSFAVLVADAVERLTKTFRGVKKDPIRLYAEMALCPIASIAKPADRIHNFGSMVGVFTIPKQIVYIKEGQDDIIPMAKLARRRFPHQVMAYENMKSMMTSQIDLIEAMHRAVAA